MTRRRRALGACLLGAAALLGGCASGSEPMVLVQRGREEPVPPEASTTTTEALPAGATTTATAAAPTTVPSSRGPEPELTPTSAPVTTTAPKQGTCQPGTSWPTRPQGERKIVFFRQGPGNGLMWVQPDGSGVELIDANASPQAWWSPDGKSLAYAAQDDQVWIVNADGTGRRSLETTGIMELAWAPDGDRFAATVRVPDGSRDVFLLDSAGRIVRQLTDTTIPSSLAWSPDGSVVLYSRSSEALPWTLWAVPAAGGEPVLLAENAMSGSWSPDGCQIGIATMDGAALIRWDGSDRRLLPQGAHRTPRWSPTGDFISMEAIGGDGILVIDADDLTTATRIFDGNAYDLQWSPDGTRIASYGRNPTSADFEVSSIKVDGTGLVNLSHDSEHDSQPHW